MNQQEIENEKVVSLLKAILYKNLSVEDALMQWPIVEKTASKGMKNAYHQIYHYLADEDIRASEPEYAKYQQIELQRCLDDLLAEQRWRHKQ